MSTLLFNSFSLLLCLSILLFPISLLSHFLTIKKGSLGSALLLHKSLLIALLLAPLCMAISTSFQQAQTDHNQLPPSALEPGQYGADDSQLKEGNTKTKQSIHPNSHSLQRIQINDQLSAQLSSGLPVESPSQLPELTYFNMSGSVYLVAQLMFLASALGAILFVTRLLKDRRLKQALLNSVKHLEQRKECTIAYHDSRLNFSSGLWKRVVFIDSSASPLEQQVLISHELNHLRLRHHHWSLLEHFLCHLLWFVPTSHLLRTQGQALRELECDIHTIKQLQANNKDYKVSQYCKLLLRKAGENEKQKRMQEQTVFSESWNNNKLLSSRLRFLLEDQKKPFQYIAIGLSPLLIAISIFFLWTENQEEAQLESLILDKIKGQYSTDSKTKKLLFSNIPKHTIDALIVHQDKRFQHHSGYDLIASARAMWQNSYSTLKGGPRFVSGGSGISQQLAKSFLNEKPSWQRKFRELKIAIVLEKHFSKEQILEMYLSRLYFGNNAWGLADAAQYYYKKHYSQLNIEESAMLIPFLDAPSKINMIDAPKLSKKRQQLLLKKLKN